MKQIVVGLGGGTASGKTYLSDRIAELADPGELLVLRTDFYYHPTHHLSLDQREKLNYDHPDQIEHKLLVEHVFELMKGAVAEVPQYNFSEHNREDFTLPLTPRPIIIVEGILALHYPNLRDKYHYSIFVDTPAELRKERRMKRDTTERGRTPRSVDDQWRETVHPMHERYCDPSKRHAHVILNGTNLTDTIASEQLAVFRRLLSQIT